MPFSSSKATALRQVLQVRAQMRSIMGQGYQKQSMKRGAALLLEGCAGGALEGGSAFSFSMDSPTGRLQHANQYRVPEAPPGHKCPG
jgi:hypothetical protein